MYFLSPQKDVFSQSLINVDHQNTTLVYSVRGMNCVSVYTGPVLGTTMTFPFSLFLYIYIVILP